MDPTRNPFAPGAGLRPPELAGREEILNEAATTLERVRLGHPARSQLLLGLRGVGKTVLLNQIAGIAEGKDFLVIEIEAPENRKLAEILVPPLRSRLLKLSRSERAADLAKKGLGALRAFASAFKVSYGDLDFGIAPERGVADSGDLESDLPELLVTVASAARSADKAVALFLDEVQYLSHDELAALIVAIHKLGQKGMPFLLFGAGLPQTAALAGEAKSYAERLFAFKDIGPLSDESARTAVRTPLERQGVTIEDAALESIVQQTRGYPYFLQEWGAHTWNVAAGTPITAADVEKASKQAIEALDQSFFRVRLDRLTPREKDYVRAMAQLGAGPHRSGRVAELLQIDIKAAGPLRNGLIKKGMLYGPQHGETAFTVPLFDEFLRRTIPDWRPPERRAAARASSKRRSGGS